MSRSYRKPYATICGHRSAADDKRVARRSVRHKENQTIRESVDWDEFLIPERYECAYNDTWCWARDGKQRLQTINHNDLNPYWVSSSVWKNEEDLMKYHWKSLDYKIEWIKTLTRK